MNRSVILRPSADADIQTVFGEFEQVQAGLGDRFVARVREMLERIEAMPELFALVWQDVRTVKIGKAAILKLTGVAHAASTRRLYTRECHAEASCAPCSTARTSTRSSKTT